MLVLRRKVGESLVLNGTGTIHLSILAIEGERVKLGVSAPPDVTILRGELLRAKDSSAQSTGMEPDEPDDP